MKRASCGTVDEGISPSSVGDTADVFSDTGSRRPMWSVNE